MQYANEESPRYLPEIMISLKQIIPSNLLETNKDEILNSVAKTKLPELSCFNFIMKAWEDLEKVTQQTFVLKTSFVFVFRRRLQDVLIKTNMFALVLRLQKTSSRRLGQDQYIRLGYTSSRRLQDVFKTSSRRLAKTSSRRLQDVLKMSSRHLQDVFKTYYQVKVFLVTQFQDIFETYSKCF